MARFAAGAFTNSLDKGREKIITRIRKSNTRIPPSSQNMLAGNHNKLSNVVELCKDLSATAEKSYNERIPKGNGG